MLKKSKKRSEVYCSRCKKTEGVFIKNNKGANGKYQYYRCRECNTAKMRRYLKTKHGRETLNKAVYKSIAKYPERQNARMLLNYHVKVGNIEKPKHCECGNPKVEGHHEDYSKPLSVTWMCRSCHADIHRLESKV